MSTEDLGPEEARAELRKQLDDRRAMMGLTRTQLAERASVSRGTVHNVFNGPVPRADTIAALARALRLDVGILLNLRRIAVGGAEQPAEVPVPAEDRLLALFQAGSAVGSALTLQLDASGRFEEFLGALHLIGLSDAETAQLREIRTRLEETDPPGRDVLIACGRVVDEVVGLVEERTSRAEFDWFKLGKLLQGIALFAAMAWPAAPDLDEARTELFYLSDAVDMSEELRAEVKEYCRVELPTTEQKEMLREAARLSVAFPR
ncbi:helix-turn-helix transcriptional regulator [Streptomyces sp. NPDC085929]|uniref:helix-turn-helix transcriptional regulator n=1 Tax=Streptomyces sp. NPDC085929 TaxID=3365739 RepID=UPI0037D616E4